MKVYVLWSWQNNGWYVAGSTLNETYAKNWVAQPVVGKKKTYTEAYAPYPNV